MLTDFLLLLILLVLVRQAYRKPLPAGIIPGPIMWELMRLQTQIKNVLNLGGMRHV
jgi:hypothetical protein